MYWICGCTQGQRFALHLLAAVVVSDLQKGTAVQPASPKLFSH
jgi:hypothetical protein